MTPFMPQDDNSIAQDDNSIAQDDNSMVQDDNHVVVVPQVDSFLSCFKMTRPCHALRCPVPVMLNEVKHLFAMYHTKISDFD